MKHDASTCRSPNRQLLCRSAIKTWPKISPNSYWYDFNSWSVGVFDGAKCYLRGCVIAWKICLWICSRFTKHSNPAIHQGNDPFLNDWLDRNLFPAVHCNRYTSPGIFSIRSRWGFFNIKYHAVSYVWATTNIHLTVKNWDIFYSA